MAAADDAHLLERLLKGDQRAYKELVTTYQSAMRAVAYVPASQQALARQAQRVQVRMPSGDWVAPTASIGLPGADPVSQTVEFRLDLPAGHDVQLGLAFPDPVSGIAGSVAKFMGVFVISQVPLAIAEGILGVLVFRLLTDVARPELERLGVIKPSMSEAVAR